MVRLGSCWREALECRAEAGEFPAAVRSLLGEMAAAGMLMQSQLKFDGAIVLQLHGDGPVKLAVAASVTLCAVIFLFKALLGEGREPASGEKGSTA